MSVLRMERRHVRYVLRRINLDDLSCKPPVAFSVLKCSSVLGNFVPRSPSSPFQFDVVLINSGQCWNESLYIFTAPVDGIYSFSFGAIISTNSRHEVALIINDKPKRTEFSPIWRMDKNTFDDEVLTVCYSTEFSGFQLQIC